MGTATSGWLSRTVVMIAFIGMAGSVAGLDGSVTYSVEK